MTASPTAPSAAAPASAPPPEVLADDLTDAEGAVLGMYDEITSEMGKDIDDCLHMASVITAAIEKHKDDLVQLKQERAELTPYQYASVQAKLSKGEEGGRVETQRKTFEQAVARCKKNSQFMEGVRALGRVGSPG